MVNLVLASNRKLPEKSMKILIVNEHALVRDGIILLLKHMDPDLQPVVADSYGDAMQLLSRLTGIDLVLADLDLTTTTGFDATRLIRVCAQAAPVVVMSARDDFDTITRAVQCGAKGFIPKKHSAELMLAALELVVRHRGTYVPPSVVNKSEVLAAAEKPAEGRVTAKLPPEVSMTPKQTEVLSLLLEGKSNKAIAKSLGVEPGTIKIHISAVLKALNVTSRTQAILRAHQLSAR